MSSGRDSDDPRRAFELATYGRALFFEKRDETLRDVAESDEDQLEGHAAFTAPISVSSSSTLVSAARV